jgi:chromosome segregation ATPase
MSMFSCVHSPDRQTSQNSQASAVSNSNSNGAVGTNSSSPTSTYTQMLNSLSPQDRDVVDRILAEGMKLKRKCKILKQALLESENKRIEDSLQVEMKLRELDVQYEQKLAEYQGSHYIALQTAKDSLSQEHFALQVQYEGLMQQYHGLDKDNANSVSQLEQLTKMWRGLQEEHHKLQNEFQIRIQQERDALKNEYVEQIDVLREELAKEIETRHTLQSRVDVLQQQVSSNVCPECVEHVSKIQQLTQRVGDMEYTKQRLEDEIVYYKEENQRLEKQYLLMKAELDKAHQQQHAVVISNGKSGNSATSVVSSDFRNLLKSEREQGKSPLLILV